MIPNILISSNKNQGSSFVSPAHGCGGARATIEFNNSPSAKKSGEAPSEATNSIWWCLLDDVRTFFEQNPEDFAD